MTRREQLYLVGGFVGGLGVFMALDRFRRFSSTNVINELEHQNGRLMLEISAQAREVNARNADLVACAQQRLNLTRQLVELRSGTTGR